MSNYPVLSVFSDAVRSMWHRKSVTLTFIIVITLFISTLFIVAQFGISVYRKSEESLDPVQWTKIILVQGAMSQELGFNVESLNRIRKMPIVKSAEAFYESTVVIRSQKKPCSRSIIIESTLPDDIIFDVRRLRKGHGINKENEIVLDQSLADSMATDIGDIVTIHIERTHHGRKEEYSEEFHVVGVVRGNDERAFLLIDKARSFDLWATGATASFAEERGRFSQDVPFAIAYIPASQRENAEAKIIELGLKWRMEQSLSLIKFKTPCWSKIDGDASLYRQTYPVCMVEYPEERFIVLRRDDPRLEYRGTIEMLPQAGEALLANPQLVNIQETPNWDIHRHGSIANAPVVNISKDIEQLASQDKNKSWMPDHFATSVNYNIRNRDIFSPSDSSRETVLEHPLEEYHRHGTVYASTPSTLIVDSNPGMKSNLAPEKCHPVRWEGEWSWHKIFGHELSREKRTYIITQEEAEKYAIVGKPEWHTYISNEDDISQFRHFKEPYFFVEQERDPIEVYIVSNPRGYMTPETIFGLNMFKPVFRYVRPGQAVSAQVQGVSVNLQAGTPLDIEKRIASPQWFQNDTSAGIIICYEDARNIGINIEKGIGKNIPVTFSRIRPDGELEQLTLNLRLLGSSYKSMLHSSLMDKIIFWQQFKCEFDGTDFIFRHQAEVQNGTRRAKLILHSINDVYDVSKTFKPLGYIVNHKIEEIEALNKLSQNMLAFVVLFTGSSFLLCLISLVGFSYLNCNIKRADINTMLSMGVSRNKLRLGIVMEGVLCSLVAFTFALIFVGLTGKYYQSILTTTFQMQPGACEIQLFSDTGYLVMGMTGGFAVFLGLVSQISAFTFLRYCKRTMVG